MDPLGVTQAVLALGLFPGGVLLGVLGWTAARAAGLRGRWSLDLRELLALALLDLATAQAPLPGSPIPALPPGRGAAPNIAIVILLAAGAVATAAPGPRPRRVQLSAVAALVAATAIALGAASLSLTAITGQPGAAMLAARAAAAAVVVAAASVVTVGGRLSPTGEATLVAGLALLGFSLVIPQGIAAWQGALAAGLAALASASVAMAVLRWREPLRRWQTHTGVACALGCAAALAAVVIAAA